MSEAISTAEFDAGARGALALLALIGAPTSATKGAVRPEAASPASDDYARGAAEARALLGTRGEPDGEGGAASSPRSAAGVAVDERQKGAAEARRLLGIEIVGDGASSGRSV